MSDAPPPGKPPLAAPRFTAGACALVVLGLVVLIPSGLCTAAMGIASIGSMFSHYSGGFAAGLSGLVTVLMLGGPFVAGGAFLIYLGLRKPK